MTSQTPIKIMVVEDNPGDARLISEGLSQIELQTQVKVVTDGDDALKRLRLEATEDHPFDLVLLDLNLPGRHGREVLTEIKKDAALRVTPTIILSSSSAANDIADCYDRHANAYVTKPDDFEEFVTLAKSIEAFWFNAATLAYRRAPTERSVI